MRLLTEQYHVLRCVKECQTRHCQKHLTSRTNRGCNKTEVGQTAIWTERWAGILAKVEFTLQPLGQISSRGLFPQTVLKSLGLLTFQGSSILALPATIIAEEPVGKVEAGRSILIDYPNIH